MTRTSSRSNADSGGRRDRRTVLLPPAEGGPDDAHDRRTTHRQERTTEMASTLKFEFDQRNLPDNLRTTKAAARLRREPCCDKMTTTATSATRRTDCDASPRSSACSILDGFTDTDVVELRERLLGTSASESARTNGDGSQTGRRQRPEQDVYQEVADADRQGFAGRAGVVFFQELASRLARSCSRTRTRSPTDTPGVLQPDPRLRRRLHVERPAGRRTRFDLPDLTGDGVGVAGRHPARTTSARSA